MKSFELTPVNNRKSFYGKCRVDETSRYKTLFSYNTNVACYDKKRDVLNITKNPDYLTNTTLTHINSFLVHCGRSKMIKKEILNG